MKVKNNRLEALRLIISSQQLGSQDELLNALQKEGFKLTQATLSRDLKQLKVAKAASMSGNYVYVLPNETMYKRVSTPNSIREMMKVPGFVSINFSGNLGIIKTRPGYASSIAWNIDNSDVPEILQVTPAASLGTLTTATYPRYLAPLPAMTPSSLSSRKASSIKKLLTH